MKCTIQILIFTVLLAAFFGCKKDDDLISTTPELTFVSITPSTATEFVDDIVITISYTDGDGDLGENNADVNNLFVTDTRQNVVYKFRIPELSPSGSEIAIKGKLNVTINGTGITDQSTSQSVVYSIYAVDRSGNKSASVNADAITIVK